MKKLITIIMLCLPLVTFAQIGRGRVFLSGGVGLSSSSPDNPEPGSTKQFTRFNSNAMVGIFVGDTWAIGLSPSYQSQTQTFVDGTKNHSNILGVGPFVRKYFPLSDRFYFHVDGSYAFNEQKDFSETPTGNGPTTKSISNEFAIRPGASYFINDRIALQAMVGQLAYTRFSNNSSKSSSIDLNFDVSSIVLGAAFYF
jgi:hypothetical protein